MLLSHLKLALKVLARRRFFTFISLFGIALTLVVLMVVVGIFENVFSSRPPESHFDRTLLIRRLSILGDHGGFNGHPGYGFLDKYARDLPSAERTSFFSGGGRVAIYHDNRKIEARVKSTDGAYWQILDFHFLEGGPFVAADDESANRVVVLSAGMREKLFPGQPTVVGKVFEMDAQRFRVVGVVDDVPIIRFAGYSEIWIPNGAQTTPGWKTQDFGNYNAMVLVRKPSDFAAVRAEFKQRIDNYVFSDPKEQNRIEVGLDTPYEAFTRGLFGNPEQGRGRTMRLIVLTCVVLFLTIPTVNLININLSRIMERASEIGVRKAFGASSSSLVGQFVLENVLLTLIGGIVGFVLSVVVLKGISHSALLPQIAFEVNLRIFLYGMAVAVAFGVISGVYPAWRMSRMQPVNALRGGAL